MQKKLVLLVVLLGAFVMAHAGTVTFDDVVVGNNDIQTHVVSDGFNFDSQSLPHYQPAGKLQLWGLRQ